MSDIYMKVPEMPGNVTTQGYEKWIALQSFDFAIRNHLPMQVGKVADRDSSYPAPTELAITKILDKSSNKFFEASCSHKVVGTVEIHVCTTGSKATPYMKYTLDNVMVGDYHHAVGANGKPTELVGLNYTKMTLSYIEQNAQGQAAAPFVSGYDLEAGKLS